MSNYDVQEYFLNEIKFRALILTLPEEEIEDKLAIFAKERGMVTRLRYEDFILTTCVSNIKDLISYIDRKVNNDNEKLIRVRNDLLCEIYKINPLLSPTNVVINKNYVLKLLGNGYKISKEDVVLPDNEYWNANYQSSTPTKEDNDKKDLKKRKIENLEYSVDKKWWTRINRFVYIKRYRAEDADVILERQFHDAPSFNTFVVSICIESFDAFFNELDREGLPSKIPPYVLMSELYCLCRDCNPFLLFENAKITDKDSYQHDSTSSSTARMTRYAKEESRAVPKKGSFRDVSRERLLRLSDNIKVFVIGQDDAINSVSNAVCRASVGLRNPERPIGSFLFAGRTGVGKTLLVKTLANELIPHKGNLIRIDGSEYSAEHEYSKLIGAPNGYLGYEEGGILTNGVMRNPFSVILFDEIEKANSKVHNLLLQILDDGILTDGRGRTVSFKDTIVIMTSNIGVEEINSIKSTIGFGDASVVTEDKKNAALDKALKKGFKPELLNRIDEVVHFKSLTKKDYMRIIDIELFKLTEYMSVNDTVYKNTTITFSDKVRDFVYKNGVDKEYGARPLSRFINKHISTMLAEELLKIDTNRITNGVKVHVDVNRKKVVFDIEDTKVLNSKLLAGK